MTGRDFLPGYSFNLFLLLVPMHYKNGEEIMEFSEMMHSYLVSIFSGYRI